MLGVLRAARGRGGGCARPSEQFPVLRAGRVGLPPSRLSSFKIPTAAMHIDDLDLTQIKLVAELLRHRSVSAASLSIGLSQSAACHALANLRTQPAIPSPLARVAVSNQRPMESGVVLRRRVARRVASWPYFKPTLRTGNEFEALQYYASDIGQSSVGSFGMVRANAGSARLAISPPTRPWVTANAVVRGFERRFLNLPGLALYSIDRFALAANMLCAQTAKRRLIGEIAMNAGHVQWWIALAVLVALLANVDPVHARSQSGDQLADLRAQVGQLYEQGKYAAAVAVAERYIALARQKHGQDHTEYAAAISWLAYVYQAQGRYAEAEPLYERDLAITEKALGPDHPAFGQSLNNLAELYRAQGRYAEAEPLYERDLAITERALGPDHPAVGTALNNLAGLYDTQGPYAEAEPLYKRALAITEKALGPDHPRVGLALNHLAGLYGAQGRYSQAESLYKRWLAIREKALGPDHPEIGPTLNNLAELYRGQGRYGDAEPLYKRALAIDEKALGPDHPDVAIDLNNLAELYRAQGRTAEAKPLLKRVLAIREKASSK